MKNIVVDFTGAKYYYDLHQILKDSLELPDFYGRNVDALWDCITGMIELPFAVTLKGLNTLPKDLENQKNLILRVFIRAQEEDWGVYVTIED